MTEITEDRFETNPTFNGDCKYLIRVTKEEKDKILENQNKAKLIDELMVTTGTDFMKSMAKAFRQFDSEYRMFDYYTKYTQLKEALEKFIVNRVIVREAIQEILDEVEI